MFVCLLTPRAVTAGGTEEAPELAHHVREGGIVARYWRSCQAFRQGVQHLVLIDLDNVAVVAVVAVVVVVVVVEVDVVVV